MILSTDPDQGGHDDDRRVYLAGGREAAGALVARSPREGVPPELCLTCRAGFLMLSQISNVKS